MCLCVKRSITSITICHEYVAHNGLIHKIQTTLRFEKQRKNFNGSLL
jgi:hypothetical protein